MKKNSCPCGPGAGPNACVLVIPDAKVGELLPCKPKKVTMRIQISSFNDFNWILPCVGVKFSHSQL